MTKLIKQNDVPSLIKDGDSIMITGITMAAAIGAVHAIEKSFLQTGHPRDLTFSWQSGVGMRGTTGLAHIAHEGLLKRGYAGHIFGCGPAMGELSKNNQCEMYNFPQGVMANLCRAVASKKPGVITKIGLGTFMDPRCGGARMNERAKDDAVELLTVGGEEYLNYKAFPINVSLIRGTSADEKGNISAEKEAYNLGILAAAQAARACGGIVICQVERIVKGGTLNPKHVKVPGALVDYIYLPEKYNEEHLQTGKTLYNPVFSGEIKVPLDSIPIEKLSMRKVIARRAAMELRKGFIVNLGVGIPEAISSVCAQEGTLDDITLTTEAGGFGGMPASGHDFGCCWNADATIEMADQFDFYDGGGLDLAAMGFLQVREDGSLNASMRDGSAIGVGGFMNVAAGASKVCFCAAFMGGVKLEDLPQAEIGSGKITITREGNVKKFVKEIEQVTFNGPVAVSEGKEILFITERCVFRLTAAGLELTEIAPGIDLEKDILRNMEFRPNISKSLKRMDSAIFNETWGGLKTGMCAEQMT